jgi:protein-tyrosine-phosphatase/tRNA A37 threonylcarbamoyladenosine synthetase subunit TsaC/SUA5/YrdC
MTEVLPWQRDGDRDAVRRAAAALVGGALVALPTEAGYVLAGRADDAAAVEGLAAVGTRICLALGGPADAPGWVPGMSPLAHRLARRCWPGPVTLICGGGLDEGLAAHLPGESWKRLCVDEQLSLRAPAHEGLYETLEALTLPLAVAELGAGGGAATAAEARDVAGPAAALVLDGGPSQFAASTEVAVNGSSLVVLREGAVSAADLGRLAARVIVFVCTGNTCRSPLAEALCKRLLAERLSCDVGDLPSRGFVVLSAGLAALPGGAAAAEAVEVAREAAADLSGHVSRPLTAALAAEADQLIVMTRGHLASLSGADVAGGPRVRLLSAAGDDLVDPIGGDLDVYRECARQVRRHLDVLLAEWLPT